MKTEGYKVQEYHGPVKRYCQTMDLRDNAELIRKYKEAHDRDHFWDEIKQGIRSVGILEMEIYILGTRLFMIVETPLDFDWDSAMARLATLPRQEEWEEVAHDGTNVLFVLAVQFPSDTVLGVLDFETGSSQLVANLV